MTVGRIGFLVSVILLLQVGMFCEISAQSNCDSLLAKLSTGPLGYRDRGDRCEGIFIQEVGGSTLLLCSFTETFDAGFKTGKPLVVEWTSMPGVSEMHLRSYSLKWKLYYRMDSYRPSASGKYLWPSDFLSSLNITSADIGIVGTVKQTINGKQNEIFVPLRVTETGSGSRTGNYTLILLPGVELKEVFMGITPVGVDGKSGKPISEGIKLGYGYYPAERGIQIPVKGLTTDGIYKMDISALLINGGTVAFSFLFYHRK